MAATWRRKDFGRAWRGPDICRKEKKGNNFITFLFKNLVRCLYKRSHGACYYERLIFIYILFPPRFFSFFLPSTVGSLRYNWAPPHRWSRIVPIV